MITQQREDELAKKNVPDHQQFGPKIGQQVMHLLGKPSDLCRVQVHHLWADRFRVNIFVGANIASAKVAHSYFLTVDEGGGIISATPKIVQHY